VEVEGIAVGGGGEDLQRVRLAVVAQVE